MKPHLALVLVPAVLAALVLGPPAAAAAPAGKKVDARALLTRVDDLFRGKSSRAVLTMKVKTDRWERNLKIEALSEGTDKSLIEILEPAKERGITTLKVGDNLWNYLPKVDRTIKVPAAMMSSSWMGSHFTNDDLVKESRLSDDYTYEITSQPDQDPKGQYVITLTPKPNAPVVWGRVEAFIDAKDELPVKVLYYDEKGKLVRTLDYSDVTKIDGRELPATMTLHPADKPDEFTRIHYDQLQLGVDLPQGSFSLQALRR